MLIAMATRFLLPLGEGQDEGVFRETFTLSLALSRIRQGRISLAEAGEKPLPDPTCNESGLGQHGISRYSGLGTLS